MTCISLSSIYLVTMDPYHWIYQIVNPIKIIKKIKMNSAKDSSRLSMVGLVCKVRNGVILNAFSSIENLIKLVGLNQVKTALLRQQVSLYRCPDLACPSGGPDI